MKFLHLATTVLFTQALALPLISTTAEESTAEVAEKANFRSIFSRGFDLGGLIPGLGGNSPSTAATSFYGKPQSCQGNVVMIGGGC